MRISYNQKFERNIPAISAGEQQLLSEKRAAVIGCGGLGGFVTEYLTRLGVGRIAAADGDVFEPSNLNRQLLSSTDLIGKSKVLAAKERAEAINPDIEFDAMEVFITEENAAELLKGSEIVIDALDNVAARFILEDAAEKLGLTVVHGAIQGWQAQVMVAPPGKRLIHSLYKNNAVTGDETEKKSCLVMAPACCASLQAAEAVKILTGRDSSLDSRLMVINLMTMETMTIEME